MIRVLVVDDHDLMREAISEALRASGGIDVIGSCADGQQACGFIAHSRPDVVLMDLAMPRLDGVEATRRILADDPTLPVVIFTSAVHGRQAIAAMDIGAVACVFKGSDSSQVVSAVRAAAIPG